MKRANALTMPVAILLSMEVKKPFSVKKEPPKIKCSASTFPKEIQNGTGSQK